MNAQPHHARRHKDGKHPQPDRSAQTDPSHAHRSARSRRSNRQRRQRHPQWPGFTAQQLESRAASVPAIVYPDELPVSARRHDIAEAIANHQVVIIAGETGSGKTTQIPKICLELGRGITGMIGHTQPRRIAARSVAERIAHELGTRVGPESIVGYQVRFTEETGPATLIKLMTDGILLAEIQSDPLLRRYDTIIVDEAHERSLNIDFILGYLANLLPQRPDLKVVITSATIDSARFAEHFAARISRPSSTAQVPMSADAAAQLPADSTASSATGTTATASTANIDAATAAPSSTPPNLTARIPAPIIEVSGRTYPVEIRYRPLVAEDENPDEASTDLGSDAPKPRSGVGNHSSARQSEEDRDQVTGILDAVDELMAQGPGDILVFLAGERDIRDTESALADHLGPRYTPDSHTRTPGAVEVVPLYSRLSAAEQHRIFEPHATRRIVLATNVAETSLTVPGIRYVIDPGLARISRYSNRTKVQRLPIEPISQASANQRSGRCGRVADGIAIRLYSQSDFLSRPEYTEPEILRTSLASVILQMAALGLGDVENFPFLDAPDHRAVRDGMALLSEIGAIEPDYAHRGPRLTRLGRRLARLPLDPRLGRMLLEAGDLGCVSEVMVIVAALSIQDVRERPADAQEASDALHRRFADPTSDFLTYLNLWRYLRTQSRDLSGSAFRRMCRAEFLHYLRVREWQDVYTQLRQLARPLGLDAAPVEFPTPRAIRAAREALEPGSHAAQIAHGDVAAAVVALGKSADTPDADAIHRSLLVGLLSNIGHWDERRREYAGTRGSRFSIWPGSGLRRKTYDWVMTAELVETSRLFARTVAKVDPRWIEEAASRAGLVKHVYGEPFWSKRNGAAMVHESVLLYGLTLAADRAATLASVSDTAREVAREMFIRRALVEGEWNTRHAFVSRNAALVEELTDVERRRREHGLLASDEALFQFYDDRVPDDVAGAIDFDAWWRREKSRHPHALDYTRELLLPGGDEEMAGSYPDTWVQGDLTLGLEYVFEPGRGDDGVSVLIPLEVLGRVSESGFDWLVPGMRAELVTATIRALPKPVRRQMVPAPDVGRQLWAAIREEYPGAGGPGGDGGPSGGVPQVSFRQAFTAVASRLRGVSISDADWLVWEENLPDYLRLTFVAVDAEGREIARNKDLVVLRKQMEGRTQAAVRTAVRGALEEALARSGQGGARKGNGGARKERTGHSKRGTADSDAAASAITGVTPGSGAKRGAARTDGGRQTGRGEDRAGSGITAAIAEKDGLTDWPTGVAGMGGAEKGTIPGTVESTGPAGLVVRGYPALIATGPTRAKLTILADEPAQRQAHPGGVVALALARTQLSEGRVTSRWSGAEALTLAASPYPTTGALVTDLQLASARTVAAAWAASEGVKLADVRDQATFERLVAHMRQALEDEVYRVAQIVTRCLQAQRDVERAVSSHTTMTLLSTLQQVREHVASLVYEGFVSATPGQELAHIPRFLGADAVRVAKAAQSVSADAALAYQAAQAEEMLDEARARAAALPADPARDEVLREARWMIEELRVSLFAQTLGTSRKVSIQRIRKLLGQV